VNLRTRSAIILAALTVFYPYAARAQVLDSAVIRRLDDVFADVAKPDIPGCALAETRAGAIAYAKGYGMAALEQRVPITPQTVFDLGSVSKQFTAASVLLLQLDGKLSLDDDVRRYLPQLPSLGATVTLRQLLTHTSGWRDYADLLLMDGFDERDHTTDRDAWDTLRRQRSLNFAPGTTYRYSNTGYFLLGEVVTRVSGQSLAAFAHARISAPLGMTQTSGLNPNNSEPPVSSTGRLIRFVSSRIICRARFASIPIFLPSGSSLNVVELRLNTVSHPARASQSSRVRGSSASRR